MQFPTPVGGTVLPIDFVPSVLFAVLYGTLLPLIVFRIIEKRSRCILLISTTIFAVERIVIYSLRAAQARSDKLRVSPGLLTYLQISFALGFVNISNDLVNILHCLLVNTTFGWDTYEQAPPAKDAPLDAKEISDGVQVAFFSSNLFKGWQRERFTGQPTKDDLDYPRRRIWFRRLKGIVSLLFVSAIVPSIIAHQHFGNLLKDQSNAASVFRLRYVGAAVALFFTLALAGTTVWAYAKLPRVRPKASAVALGVCVLMSVIAIYRLSVMYNETTSLLSVGPHTHNSPRAKAGFYILHSLPEWLASLLLFGVNIRQLFGTGSFGDWRRADETEAQRNKRLEKEKRAAEKKAKKGKKRPFMGEHT